MLEMLVKYAQTHDLMAEPGFKPKEVRWAIALDSKRGLIGLEELGQLDQKNNRGRYFAKCPDLSQAELIGGPTARSHFLVETASVVALFNVDPRDSKAKEKHQFFIDMLAESGKTYPQFNIIVGYLLDEETKRKTQLLMADNKVKKGDKVTFRLDAEFPLEQDYWHDWWNRFRLTLKGEPKKLSGDNQMRCFIKGDFISPIKTHLKIEGLANVGGLPVGDVLIGFDKEAFRSYGLEQSDNAAVSEESMNFYRAGLNHLIKNHSQKLAGARVVHWFNNEIFKAEDPFSWLEDPPEVKELHAQHEAKKMLNSIWTGERADLAKNRYYALTLSGAGGRVMVRDWMEGEFKELVTSIDQWFSDLEVVSLFGDKIAKIPGLERVITSLLPPKKPAQKYEDWVKPICDERLMLLHAAVKGSAITYNVIPRLILEHRDLIINGELEQLLNERNWSPSIGIIYSLLYTRIGLIKAYFLRKYRKEGKAILAEMLKPGLNEDFPSPAYQCGCLLEVLAELQRAALGDVGAGVVQRYYGAASSTPALVLGRLTRTSQFHLSKLEPGRAYWFESRIANLWSRLNQSPPKVLSLEEQSLFAMGYYQQMAEMRAKKSKDSQEEDNNV
jgi:CRISPR-associated protein Csd1